MAMEKATVFAVSLFISVIASSAFGADVHFKDPVGDDNGPGSYTYPTDAVYTPGSFDITDFDVKTRGDNVVFGVSVNARLADPWGMGVGFATQMVFIFIDTDNKPGSGHTTGLPGLNIQFDPKNAWEKVVILSPQKQARVMSEAKIKAPDVLGDIVVPVRTTGSGKTIEGAVKLADLGGGDPAQWSYQVCMQSNEGFPTKTDLLTRRVNEFEGQHRYGGGNDADCDPHVMDVLAGKGEGKPEEVALQHEMLAYQCDDAGNAVKRATLTMVRK